MPNISFKYKNFIYAILAISLFSCVEEADQSDFNFSKKTLILGYVGNHQEPARINILHSVPIDSRGLPYELETNAIVSLMELTKTNEVIEYNMTYSEDWEMYLSADSGIAKNEHSYWAEINLGDKLLKSVPIKMTNQPTVIISEPVNELVQKRYRYDVEVTDNDEYFSYIIGDFGRGINLFLTLEYYFFFDKKYRLEPELLIPVYLYQASEVYDPYVYIMQVPHEVNDFFSSWTRQFEGTDEPDFFTQMLSIPPANLKSNFMYENGQAAEDIIGVFFPGFAIKHRNEE